MTEVSTRPSEGATKQPAQPPAPIVPAQHAGGFSQQQCELVFNAISSQAEALRSVLTEAMDRSGRQDNADMRDYRLALHLTTLIGATADHMGGCTHLGTVADWACAGDMWPGASA